MLPDSPTRPPSASSSDDLWNSFPPLTQEDFERVDSELATRAAEISRYVLYIVCSRSPLTSLSGTVIDERRFVERWTISGSDMRLATPEWQDTIRSTPAQLPPPAYDEIPTRHHIANPILLNPCPIHSPYAVNNIYVLPSPRAASSHRSHGRRRNAYAGIVEVLSQLRVSTSSQHAIIGRMGQVPLDFDWGFYLSTQLALSPGAVNTIIDILQGVEQSQETFS